MPPNTGDTKAIGSGSVKTLQPHPIVLEIKPRIRNTTHSRGISHLPPPLLPQPHLGSLFIHFHPPNRPFPWLTPLQTAGQFHYTLSLGFHHALHRPFRTSIDGLACLCFPLDFEPSWKELCPVHLLSLVPAKCLAYIGAQKILKYKQINTWKISEEASISKIRNSPAINI